MSLRMLSDKAAQLRVRIDTIIICFCNKLVGIELKSLYTSHTTRELIIPRAL